MKIQKLIGLIFILIANSAVSQTYLLSGCVKSKTENLAFATIMVKGTSVGCSSNSNGFYQLSLPAGTYEIEFHYLGYSKQVHRVTLQHSKKLDVILENEGVQLKEIEVEASEDPSYPIIRRCIEKREYYFNQVDAYSCQTYIKGFQKVVELPKNFDKMIKLLGGKNSDAEELSGVIYLSESESQYFFKKPNEVHETMFSSKVSGNSRSFSFNKLSDMNINFYKNLVDMPGLSDRPLISPIHNNAFFYYRYFLIGTDSSEHKKIYKIKVVPKRSTDPCFKGILYVQDQTWRFTGIDLKLFKSNKINFVDTLYLKQIHASIINDSVWMPVNLNMSFDFKVLGVKGYGYFNAHLKNFVFNPIQSPKSNQNELLHIVAEADKKDSAYWEQNRPMPLTDEEKLDYKQKDSLNEKTNSKRYQDSVDRINNRFELNDLISGYTYFNTRKNLKLTVPGIANSGVQYNTVEGLNLSYQITFEKTFKQNKKTEINSKIRYGCANQLWGGEFMWQHDLNVFKFSKVGLKLKSMVEQFNEKTPIMPLINSVYTLLLNENYMKLFKESGLEATYQTELRNGLFFNGKLSYLQRDPLKNSSILLLIDDKYKEFSSNDPFHATTHDSLFNSNNAFVGEISFLVRFKQKYYSLPNQKIIIGSKYPKISITYKKAMPLKKSDANFDLITATINDNIKFGLLGKFAYKLKGGAFLNTKKMYAMDYKHFLGNQTFFNSGDYLSSFKLLPYYTYSTNQWFFEGHAEHHFRGFIFNKIPILKKGSVQEIIGIHCLQTKAMPTYYEVNFGLERIFKLIRFDYVLSYSQHKKLKSGFTVGLSLSF